MRSDTTDEAQAMSLIFANNTVSIQDGAFNTVAEITPDGMPSSYVRFTPSGVGAVPRTAQAKLRDFVDAKDFGAAGDAVTDDVTPLGAALSAAPGRVVRLAGIGAKYLTSTSFYGYLDCRFEGEGQLVIGGKGQARNRAFITNEVADPDYSTLENYFDGDWSKQISTNFTFVGSSVGATAITDYRLMDRASQTSSMFVNTGGKNTATGNQTGGRTGIFRENVRLIQGGQGDLMSRYTFAQAYSTRSGATHFLACPAVSLEAADIQGLADGNYLQQYEVNFGDEGHAVAVGNVRNYDRTNAGATLYQTWKHDFVNSRGSQPIDVVYQGIGLIKRFIDTTSATLTDGSVIAMKADQRIHLDATVNNDPIGVPMAPNVTDTWIGYDSASGAVLTSLAAGKKVGVKNAAGTFTADPTAWATPSLSSSWVSDTGAGESAPQYRRDISGKVIFRGHASGGTSYSSLFTLPVGFRPPHRMRFVVMTLAGIATITIDTAGVVYVLDAAGTSPKYVSLDGISFDLAA